MTQTLHATRLAELEQIISHRQDWLFRFAYMRVGNREDAEDIVQDTLLRLFNSDRDLSHVESAEQYLIRSLSNACQNHLRKHPPLTVGIESAYTLADNSNPDHELHDEYQRIARLLSQLPEPQAETLRLHLIDELTLPQIAQLHDLPLATVKSRYRYGIERLKQIISNDKSWIQ